MGFRYRKSINLGGGFRINLSKSGIGYSWGVKGYRITKTADGKTRRTVSIPGTGISYSDEIGQKGKKASSQEEKQANLNSSYHDIREVKSAEITALKSDTYNRLFHQIKKRKIIVYGLAVVAVLLISVPPLCLTLLMIDWILSRFLKIPLIYEFDEYQHEKWDELSAAWRKVATSKDLQEITLNAKANNPRINAGISNVIDSKSMSAGGRLPWFLKTNVKPVVFTLQKSKMAILPDGIMFFDKKIGALD